MENHGTVYATRFKRLREAIEAMKEIWTKSEAEYHGEFVNFDRMIARPKPVQKPHPSQRICVDQKIPYGALVFISGLNGLNGLKIFKPMIFLDIIG
jgi:hypothetical protein